MKKTFLMMGMLTAFANLQAQSPEQFAEKLAKCIPSASKNNSVMEGDLSSLFPDDCEFFYMREKISLDRFKQILLSCTVECPKPWASNDNQCVLHVTYYFSETIIYPTADIILWFAEGKIRKVHFIVWPGHYTVGAP